MDYIENIIKAINYIEDNLFNKHLANEVYKAVYSSKFHFHRTFLLVSKCTLGQYIKRRRFKEILKWIESSDQTILDIALASGYSSHEAFTRAFKAYFGKTPSQ